MTVTSDPAQSGRMLFERPDLAELASDTAHVAHQVIDAADPDPELAQLAQRALGTSDPGELAAIIAEVLTHVDAAVLRSAEWGDVRAIHHGLACAKELAVLDRILTLTRQARSH
jgi:hypothetical protein